MEIINTIFFIIISLVVIVSALGVIFLPGIIYSAISLIVTFLSIAGLFVLLNADFVAVSQIIVYGVGITIIILFAIMLTGVKLDKKLWIAIAPRTLPALAVSFATFILISFTVSGGYKILSSVNPDFKAPAKNIQVENIIRKDGTTAIIGKSLLNQYVLPFEVLSFLLLAAIIGAVVIAKKDEEVTEINKINVELNK